jgi:hypothetical protein
LGHHGTDGKDLMELLNGKENISQKHDKRHNDIENRNEKKLKTTSHIKQKNRTEKN